MRIFLCENLKVLAPKYFYSPQKFSTCFKNFFFVHIQIIVINLNINKLVITMEHAI